jgi:hypothetical protein
MANPQTRLRLNPAARESRRDYLAAPVMRPEHREDAFTRIIEQQSAKIPSVYFLVLSLSAMTTSLLLELRGRTRESRFVGMWPPALLSLGIYNKILKSMGTR